MILWRSLLSALSLTFTQELILILILHKLGNIDDMIFSLSNLSSYGIRLVHIDDELYSQMISKTFVAAEIRVACRRNSKYDAARVSGGDSI